MAEREPVPVRDRGFTLPELIISIAVTSIVVAAIATTFSVVIRTQPATEARIDDARTLLGVSTWLPADVSSTPIVPVAEAPSHYNLAPGTGSGCGMEAGINLLRLRWTETIGGGTTTYTAAYRYVESNGWRIVRVACSGDGAATSLSLTSALPPPGDDAVQVAWKVSDAGMVYGIEMTITTFDGDQVRVDATSKNPNEVLGSVPEGVTPPPPSIETTTTTTTIEETTTTTEETTTTTIDETSTTVEGETATTAPESTTTSSTTTTTTTIPCSASFASVSPNPVRNQQGSGQGGSNQIVGPLRNAVTVDITRSGNCAALGLEYLPDPETPPATVRWKLFGDSVRVTLESIDTERWRDGARPLILRDGHDGPVLASTTLSVV